MKSLRVLLAGAAVVALALLAWWLVDGRPAEDVDAPLAGPASAESTSDATFAPPPSVDGPADAPISAMGEGASRAAVEHATARAGGVLVLLVDEHGAPVPHARVGYLSPEREAGSGERHVALQFAGYDRDDLPLYLGDSFTADADGRVVVPAPRTHGRVAAHSERLFGAAELDSDDDEVVVRMRRSPRLRVRFVDRAGIPVADGPIALSVHVETKQEELRTQHWSNVGLTDSDGWGEVSPDHCARLPEAASASVALVGVFDELQAAVCLVDGVPVDPPPVMRVPDLVAVRLRVTEADGAAVPFAACWARSVAAESAMRITRAWAGSVAADAEGRAVLFPVEAGISVVLGAVHPAGGRSVELETTSGPEELVLALHADDLALAFDVADESGVALAGRAARDRDLTVRLEVLREDGTEEIIDACAVRRPDWRLEVRLSGSTASWSERLVLHVLADDPWASAHAEVPLPATRTTLEPVDLGTLDLAGAVTLVVGRVVDPAGRPIRNARVRAADPGAAPDEDAYTLTRWMNDRSSTPNRFPVDRTDREGRFELVGPARPGGRVDVHVIATARRSPLRVPAVPVGTTDLHVELRPSVTVRGELVGDARVLEALQLPSHVRLVREDGDAYPASSLYFDGGFEFADTRGPDGPCEGVEVGTYRLELGAPTFPPFAVVEGLRIEPPRRGFEVDLGPIHVDGLADYVTLTVVDEAGDPIPGAVAYATNETDPVWPSWWRGDEAGEILLPRDPSGLDLQVGADGYPPRDVLRVTEDREVALAAGPEIVLHWPDMPALPPGARIDPALAAAEANPTRASRIAGASFDANGEARFRASFFGEAVLTFYAWGPGETWIGPSFTLGEDSENGAVRVVIPDDPDGSRITVRWPRSVVDALVDRLR